MTEQRIAASKAEIDAIEAFIRAHNQSVQAEAQAKAALGTAWQLWAGAKGLTDAQLIGTTDDGHVRVMVPEEKKD